MYLDLDLLDFKLNSYLINDITMQYVIDKIPKEGIAKQIVDVQ